MMKIFTARPFTARVPGLDVFYRITTNLVSATTFNTDFAETESDARQVNLTRFDLFFPEKRSFFVEDAGIFSFAPEPARGQGEYAGTPDLMPFFSRRVGMVEGTEAPIRVGEKITGTMGRFDIGLLAVRTGESDVNADGFSAPPATRLSSIAPAASSTRWTVSLSRQCGVTWTHSRRWHGRQLSPPTTTRWRSP